MHTALPYHIRVVVPCYKEPLEVVQKTVTAALVAPIPVNCTRTGGRGRGRLRACELLQCSGGDAGQPAAPDA